MPIRRVFGTVVFNVHERVDMPRPGETRAGSFHLRVLDPAWHFALRPDRAHRRDRRDPPQSASIPDHSQLSHAGILHPDLLLVVVALWR